MFLNVLRVKIMMMKLTKGIPSLAKSCRGPIPESKSTFGEPTTPALSKDYKEIDDSDNLQNDD